MNIKASLLTFVKNASIVCAGTFFAQVISLLAAIVLTRIYAPDQFGDYSLILAFAGFLGGVSCMSLDNAAMLTPKLSDMKHIFATCMIVAFIFASICVILLFVANIFSSDAYNNFDTLIDYSFFIWVYIFMQGVHNVMNAIVARLNKNASIGVTKGVESLVNHSFTILLGLLGFGVFGLCTASFLALMMGILILWKAANHLLIDGRFKINFESIKDVIKSNIRLPKYHFFTSILLNFNTVAVILLLSVFYNAAYVGLIAFALRILRTPYIITKPLANVFTSMITNHGSIDRLRLIYISIVLNLMLLATVGVAVVQYIPESFIVFVFGESWSGLLEPLKILAILASAEIIQNILSGVYILCKKQKLQLVLVALQTTVMVMIVWVFSGVPNADVNNMLRIFSLCTTACILIQLLVPIFFIARPQDFVKKVDVKHSS